MRPSLKSGGQSKVWSNGHDLSNNHAIVTIVTLEYARVTELSMVFDLILLSQSNILANVKSNNRLYLIFTCPLCELGAARRVIRGKIQIPGSKLLQVDFSKGFNFETY